MNKNDLRELYKLEEKMQLLEAGLRQVTNTIPDLKGVIKEIEDLNTKFERDRQDIWTFINTMTEGLRSGEKLKEARSE